MERKSTHWADINAEKIIREKGEKEVYVAASGITPSGTVHIGNFREIITVELVVRALRDMGKKVRFIYSWDDYDVFRKVPKNMPEQDRLREYLKKPITLVPDVTGKAENYAKANEKELEELLHKVGVDPEYIYQAERYRSSLYAEGMKLALEKEETIREILNEHRSGPLGEEWKPVSVFCTSCDRNTTRVTGWDGEYGVSYECSSCGNQETVDLRQTGSVKLPWRIDWPMRWEKEGVDFEPAGKDHHSEGGSFDTARRIVKEVYGGTPPVTFQYDFIRIKGRGGKISSSTGEVVSLRDVFEIYQPEIVRYLFAGTKPNSEFAISFDLDVLKIYEDYDKCERIYFGTEEVGEKRREKERRIYELSQVKEVPKSLPYQLPLRHLCNLLQIHDGDIDAAIEQLGDVEEGQKPRLRVRANCAWNWLNLYAPEDFTYRLRSPEDPPVDLDENGRTVVSGLKDVVANLDTYDEKSLAEALYGLAEKAGVEPKEMFRTIYSVLIGKERGPRLANFIITIGKEKIEKVLKGYS